MNHLEKKKKNSMNKSWGSVSSVEEITRSPIEDERDENEAQTKVRLQIQFTTTYIYSRVRLHMVSIDKEHLKVQDAKLGN